MEESSDRGVLMRWGLCAAARTRAFAWGVMGALGTVCRQVCEQSGCWPRAGCGACTSYLWLCKN